MPFNVTFLFQITFGWGHASAHFHIYIYTVLFIYGLILQPSLMAPCTGMVIMGLSYFGYIWGPIGMLISVPIMAMVKTAATVDGTTTPDTVLSKQSEI